MTDRRLTPANGRVAARHLLGRIEAESFQNGEQASVVSPLVDLWSDPAAQSRDRQLLMGEAVTVYERRDGMAFVQAGKDGYVGYVPEDHLGNHVDPTHVVAVMATHLYPDADMKRTELSRISHGSRLRIVAASDRFFETEDGTFVPRPALRPANRPVSDPATVAQLFFGVPYLWGGNSADGIDCSGLIQASLVAWGRPCPGDSDLQAGAVGQLVDPDVPVVRGDLFFWHGHVAMAVDSDVLIHANAHHMAVVYERIADAVARIDAQGDGPLLSRRRPV